MDAQELFNLITEGKSGGFIKKMKFSLPPDDFHILNRILKETELLLKRTDVMKLKRMFHNFQLLDNYQKWIEHPIYLNEFKDKYGNVYLQGRTPIKDAKGKKKWLHAYVGSLSDFPKGTKDEAAIEKANMLIRSKLKEYYELK